MKRFTLTESELPSMWGGHLINTDFHVILKIIKMLNDPELSADEKPLLLARMFFTDYKKGKIPPIADAMKAFRWFESCGAEEQHDAPHGAKDFDFEQDAREIYASFRQVYGIDLMHPLHWWAFSALLDGVTAVPCALSSKIHLRHMDDGKSEIDAAIDRAKRAAAIEDTVSLTDKALDDELVRRLANGLPFDDLIGG